jgi:hypothetical protein
METGANHDITKSGEVPAVYSDMWGGISLLILLMPMPGDGHVAVPPTLPIPAGSSWLMPAVYAVRDTTAMMARQIGRHLGMAARADGMDEEIGTYRITRIDSQSAN